MIVDIILALLFVSTTTYAILSYNDTVVSTGDLEQINKEKGKEIVVDRLGLSYNELHSFVTGLSMAVGLSVVFDYLPVTASVIFIEIILLPLGLSLHSYVKDYHSVPAKAIAYTVRAEPWYFLSVFNFVFVLLTLI